MADLARVLSDIAGEADRIVAEVEATRRRAQAVQEAPPGPDLPEEVQTESALADGQSGDDRVEPSQELPPVIATQEADRGNVPTRPSLGAAVPPVPAGSPQPIDVPRPQDPPPVPEPPPVSPRPPEPQPGTTSRAEQIARAVINRLGISTLIRFIAGRPK